MNRTRTAIAVPLFLVSLVAIYLSTQQLAENTSTIQGWTRSDGWTTSPYGEPDVLVLDDVQIGNSTIEPAGLFFRHELDPGTAYRLTMSGHVRQGHPTLRIRLNDDDPFFVTAPDGTERLVLDDTHEIELLFFSNDDFSYTLTDLELVECSDCFTDNDLRAVILAEIPALSDLLASGQTLAAGHHLLNWVAHLVDAGTDWPTVERVTSAIYTRTAAGGYEIWKHDEGGAVCGAFAVYMAKVLRLFGLDAFTMNFGYPVGHLTHVTTVLPVLEGSTHRFYVLDPMFNALFVDTASGRPIHVEEVLRRHASGSNDFRLAEAPLTREAILSQDDLPGFQAGLATMQREAACRPIADVQDWVVCSFDYDAAYFLAGWAPQLDDVGIPATAEAHEVYLHLLSQGILNLGMEAAPDVMTAFRQVLTEYGVSERR